MIRFDHHRVRFALASWLLLVAGSAFAGFGADGPYLLQWTGEQGVAQWATHEEVGRTIRSEPVVVGQSVRIDAVDGIPAFDVILRAPAVPAADRITAGSDVPLLVVADTHGEYQILVTMLRRHGILDEKLQWAFGDGQLVFLGDVFDRGAHQVEILWLIYKLEAEAAASGGAVHLLLGNHEAMVLQGDVRYLNPKYVQTAEALGVTSYTELFTADSLLGQWLRLKPSVIKIDRLLLAHAGISPDVVADGQSLEHINEVVRAALNGVVVQKEGTTGLMLGSLGPLWYRGYFSMRDKPAQATMADIDAALAHFDVDKILVGHTPVPTIKYLYTGKVLAVQVYPHLDEADGSMVAEAALRYEGGWYRLHANGMREHIQP